MFRRSGRSRASSSSDSRRGPQLHRRMRRATCSHSARGIARHAARGSRRVPFAAAGAQLLPRSGSANEGSASTNQATAQGHPLWARRCRRCCSRRARCSRCTPQGRSPASCSRHPPLRHSTRFPPAHARQPPSASPGEPAHCCRRARLPQRNIYGAQRTCDDTVGLTMALARHRTAPRPCNVPHDPPCAPWRPCTMQQRMPCVAPCAAAATHSAASPRASRTVQHVSCVLRAMRRVRTRAQVGTCDTSAVPVYSGVAITSAAVVLPLGVHSAIGRLRSVSHRPRHVAPRVPRVVPAAQWAPHAPSRSAIACRVSRCSHASPLPRRLAAAHLFAA